MSAETIADLLRRLSCSGRFADPTVPAVGQPWQAKEVGFVECIHAIATDRGLVYFNAERSHYVAIENLMTCWRYVGHVPERYLMIEGRFVKSWREMTIAYETTAKDVGHG